jgi:acyl-CoA thioesterase FadM
VFDRFDIWLPRVHLECDFRYPPRLYDHLRVAAYFTAFGTSSITINFDVLHLEAHELAAVGHEVLVCTSRTSLESRPLPAELRALLEPYTLTKSEARHSLGLEDD